MDAGTWAEWFELALANSVAGDLLLAVDEAPDDASRVRARAAAVRALRAVGADELAMRHLRSLREEAPAIAQSVETVDEPTPPLRGPQLAVVFSGHMVDAPDRKRARFPNSGAPAVGEAIGRSLARLGVRAGDVAISSAAAGGDILFIEAALAAGMALTVCLPFSRARFLESSVGFAGPEWTTRFERIMANPAVTIRELPEPDDDDNPYERCNRWMAYLGLASGASSVRGLLVWDEKRGDGDGGAEHMGLLLRGHGVPVDVISPGQPS